ncbi:MAG: hypothetical protein ABWZ78_00335, partial [Burkholderiaceae bacterium]
MRHWLWRVLACCGAATAVCAALPALGQQGVGSADTELPDVVVSASRREQQTFDAPAAIQAVGR